MKTKITLSILSLALFLSYSFTSNSNSQISARVYRNIKTYDLQTKLEIKFSQLLVDDQLNVIVFHSLTCPFNTVYKTKIDSIHEAFTSDSIRLIYINSNSLENNIKEISPTLNDFVSRTNNSYLLDKSAQLKNIFNIHKNGTILVCKQEGLKGIKTYFKGPVDDSPQSKNAKTTFLDAAIKAALEDKTTKIDAIQTGCRIINH